MSNRRILLSYAHPDDESFGSGGMISRYVAEGADVFYICATNGDVGTVAPEKMEGYNSIAELRIAELDCASVKLGFKEVFKFGYRDSGMMYSDTTKDPASLWQAPRDAVARRVVEVIRKVKPQVIVTFNKFGGYGHPDHIAIQRATTDAFKLAGDPTYETGQEPYQPQKLYYSAFSTLMFRVNLLRVRMRGEDPRKLGRNKDFDMLAILENIEPIHTEIDVKNYLEAWDEASACHDSQLGGGMPRLPMWFRRTFVHKQSFTRVHPAPAYNRIDEHDLFTGVKPD
ncbi:MAG: PIG-L family deacetylase [Chloroflexi bacterium]|nr:PIG-L family deacetylase [Chloroflexota bacterium]MCC6897153.1 PIG-L family deacetylase [Anaerolineae bacterium]